MSLHLKRAVLALDPGGSKCEAMLADEDGTVIGWGRVQQPGLSGRSEEAVVAAAKQAVGQCTFDELHVVSYGNAPKRGCDLAANARARSWPIGEQDGVLALMGEKSGVVVVAGTGNRISARTRDDRHLSLDAMGPLLGDYGGGYYIGREGLRAAALAFLHPRHSTSMKQRLMAAFVEVMSGENENAGRAKHIAGLAAMQEGSPEELLLLERSIIFSLAPQDRSAVASLARIVNEEAERGDAVAIRILKEAASAISERIFDLLDRLQIANEEYLLVGTGSIAQKSDIYWNHLCGLIREMAPRFKAVRLSDPAVLGNAVCAFRELSPDREERIRQQLLSTYHTFSSKT